VLTSLGLFVYGFLGLFSLSALLAAARFRLSRRAVLTRAVPVLGVVAGTAVLAWRDHLGLLTAGFVWSAAGMVLLAVAGSARFERS